ncbi:MAG TPA: hypothetical protein VFZ59_08275 [Verrucomicrobiae bacterium]|nr:hypothetical protein [Verrucomicrobiae bacterium]
MKLVTAIALTLSFLACSIAAGAGFKLTPTGESTDPGFIEITGVEAGEFDPGLWQAGSLNLLPDIRSPLIEPLPGKFRNIYAPSAVETPGGWRVFYGAWDGVPTSNDRIYSVNTRDFLSFTKRHTVIEHGVFQHVCNVSAVTTASGGFALLCTVYPDARGLNKPAFFTSPDGDTWNGSPTPCIATSNDIIRIHGYEKYADADINGMNVLLREGDRFRTYFSNFKDFGRVYRASGTNGRDFQFEGVALSAKAVPNDVKVFRVGTTNWYLMGLHLNGAQTWFSLSPDGLNFAPIQPLFTNASPAERYIVAVGWVTRGEQEQAGRRLLGVLHGAGAKPSLDANRIFARWLQPRIILRTADGRAFSGTHARGPARQLIPLTEAEVSNVELFDESGTQECGQLKSQHLQPGRVYRLERFTRPGIN